MPVVEVPDRLGLALQYRIERLPIPRRGIEIIGQAVEQVARLYAFRGRSQNIGQGQSQFGGEVADRVVIGIDELATMLSDLLIGEDSAGGKAATADAGIALIDIGPDAELQQLMSGAQSGQSCPDDGDPRRRRAAGNWDDGAGGRRRRAGKYAAPADHAPFRPRFEAGSPHCEPQKIHQGRSGHAPVSSTWSTPLGQIKPGER